MIELLIMRHAKSDWAAGETDFNRPLNDRGTRAADRMALWLQDEQIVPDRVLSSSAVRARTTAMAVVYGCSIDRSVVDFDDELYLADAFTWLQKLATQTCQRLLICGHNPGLDDLVDFLVSGPVPLSASGKLMTTAAIAHLRFDGGWGDIDHGTATLVAMMRPRELEL